MHDMSTLKLFEDEELIPWVREWQNMPEFSHEDLAPKFQIIVYSNMLIRTFATDREGRPFRNVTFFNEDTDLCLRVLKSGWCTVLFNAFLVYKATTMTMGGGNTDYYNQTAERREFVEELQQAHPDVVQLTSKWGRWHHHVNYSLFKHQLRRRADVVVPPGVNNFGMVLEERVPGTDTWRESAVLAEAQTSGGLR